jgi:exopolysaccharide biosynthesis polyprenyl glycosylphosphotransferase
VPKTTEVNFRLFLLATDVSLTLVSLFLARLARLQWALGADLGSQRAADIPWLIYVLVALLWVFFLNALSVYSPRKMGNLLLELRSAAIAILAATATLAGVLYLSYREVPRLLFIYFCLFDLCMLLGFRALLRLLFQVRNGREREAVRVLILGAGKVGRDLVHAIQADPGWTGERVVGFLDDDPTKQGSSVEGITVLGCLDAVCQVVEQERIHEVIFALPLRAHKTLINLVVELQKLPVEVKVVPDLFDLAFARTTVEEVDGLPLISLRSSAINGYVRVVKRVFDMVLSGAFLTLSLPVMGIIAIAIKRDSPGPVIFRQWRVGENGRLFTMYKFRTMVDGADKQLAQVMDKTAEGKVVHKRADDPRITRLGHFLRHFSLDEIPQLFNVIKGDMSLVGPRPELPDIVDQFYEPWQRRRLAVPPGMTGWWQISGRSDKPMHLHTEDDLYYIQNYSLLLDLRILIETLGATIRGRGAY